MADDTHQRITALFAKEALAREAKLLKDPQDWERMKDIRTRHDQTRDDERQDFDQTYQARLGKARQKLIDEAGGKRLEHPTPFGVDRFDKTRINAEADRQVRYDHARRMGGIDEAEMKEVQELLKRAAPENRPHQSFARANEAKQPAQSRPPQSRSR